MSRNNGTHRKRSVAPQTETVCQGTEPPLARALFRVSRALFFEAKAIPELDALPLAQLRLLWTVHFSPDATMKDFSERLGVSQSTVTQLAERLVRRGLVERIADPHDRRVVRLRVSESGRRILDQADQQRRKTVQSVWNGLSAEEQAAVMEALEILGRTAEAVRAEEGRPLPPWPEKLAQQEEPASELLETAEPQPIVNLMERRVRGRALP